MGKKDSQSFLQPWPLKQRFSFRLDLDLALHLVFSQKQSTGVQAFGTRVSRPFATERGMLVSC